MKLTIAFPSLLLALNARRVYSQGTVCDSVQLGQSQYKVFDMGTTTITRTQAKAFAEASTPPLGCEAGTLALLKTVSENIFMIGVLNDNTNTCPAEEDYWIGLNDIAVEGTFEWDDGTPVSYSAFCNGEPNNAGGIEDHGEFTFRGSGQGYCWNDSRDNSANGGSAGTNYIVEYNCPSVSGHDPHFQAWGGKWYDFMGACDLMFLHAPKFEPNMALDIRVRTTTRYNFSYIENAIIKIGDDTLEVSSYGDYYISGVSQAAMPAVIGGFPITHIKKSEKVHLFEIDLGDGEKITLSTFKDWVSIKFNHLHSRFEGSVGMLGEWETGTMFARDGTTVIEDANAFGAEWQVREEDGQFFQTVRAPQYPQECVMPDPEKSESRRLGEAISMGDAEAACAKHGGMSFTNCVHDVIASGDLELATDGDFYGAF